jgi:hypothetical protein
MLFDKLNQSGIHRGVFAVLLATMWLMPIVLGWIAYEASHHHMKILLGFCAVGCLLELYAITFLLGGLKFIRTRA